MSKPAERTLCALVAATVLLAAPARAGVTGTEAIASPGTELGDGAAPVYQLRCWQHGRLLFEEQLASLPNERATYGLRISGSDRHQRPIYVAETQNATCLIRSIVLERGWPRGSN